MQKEKKRRYISRIVSLIIPHRGALFLGFLFLAGGAGVNLLFPEIIRRLINTPDPSHLISHFWSIAGGLVLLIGLQAVCFYFRSYIFGVVGQKVVARLRQDLYSAIITQETAFFDRARVGDLISRLASDTALLQNTVSINVSVFARYLLQVIAGTVLMCLISVRLTLTILIVLPILIGTSIILARRLKKVSKMAQEELGKANVVAEETAYGVRTVKAFGREEYEKERYNTAVDRSLALGIKRTEIAAFFQASASFLMNASIVVVLWYGVKLVTAERLTFGDLTGFLLYGVIVAVSFAFLARIYAEFMQALGAAERIFEIMERKNTLPLPETPKVLRGDSSGRLEFNSVDFAYPNRPDVKVLSSISFTLESGDTLALVGPSGAGKSTIVALTLRFYDPVSGSVTFDGFDLRELDPQSLYSRMAVVSQDPELFSVSIAENIRYGRIDARFEEIKEAARRANILQFIESLPEGFETLVGDRGVQLSGGQKQRVAIARAMLKNPSLLILDEATSALDSENEALVQDALSKLMAGRSTLVIAHRLATVQNANKLLVLQHGKIVQSGTHLDLSTQSGLYRDLLSKQELSTAKVETASV